jgi:hypothetical protein
MLLVPAAASAQSMNAEAFYQRASALQKKGPLALFQRGEIRALMTEGQAAGKKAVEQRREAMATGRKPRYCPPEGGSKMDSSDFLRRLAAIPAAERARMDMTEATTRVLAGKFPCPA